MTEDPKDVKIARLEYALLRIMDEAYRENGSWTHLKRCIAVQAKEALGGETFSYFRERALNSRGDE